MTRETIAAMLKYLYKFYAFLQKYQNKKLIYERGSPMSLSFRIFNLQILFANLENQVVEITLNDYAYVQNE
jgi:hypothetical protein